MSPSIEPAPATQAELRVTPSPWIREQILANAKILYPYKSHLTMDTLLYREQINTNGSEEKQYLYCANVICTVEEEGDEEEPQKRLEVLVYGKPVVGTRGMAMEMLAGVLEDRLGRNREGWMRGRLEGEGRRKG